MRGYLCVTGGLGLACVLAVVAATAGAASKPDRTVFRVTLQAKVTKGWNTVIESTEDGCPTTTRSIGRRTIALRSARPTLVVVRFGAKRVTFSPTTVRFIGGQVTRSGNRTTRTLAPCPSRTVRAGCARTRRALRGKSVSFFRSERNEISFRRTRHPELESACPPQSAEVRAIRPGLQEAEGAISEAALANARIPAQTALGSSEVTTELEGDETGSVVERVHWALTFTRPG